MYPPTAHYTTPKTAYSVDDSPTHASPDYNDAGTRTSRYSVESPPQQRTRRARRKTERRNRTRGQRLARR